MFIALYELFFGRQFESPYNMDEVLRRLEKRVHDDVMLPNSKLFRTRRWYLHLREDYHQWGYYNFLCRPRWGFLRTNYTIAKGQLQPNNTGVYVTGIIRFDRLSSIILVGVPISIPIFLWLNADHPNLFPLMLLIVTVSTIDVVISRMRVEKQLYELITSTLGGA